MEWAPPVSNAPVAQRIERRASNAKVGSSILSGRTKAATNRRAVAAFLDSLGKDADFRGYSPGAARPRKR